MKCVWTTNQQLYHITFIYAQTLQSAQSKDRSTMSTCVFLVLVPVKSLK